MKKVVIAVFAMLFATLSTTALAAFDDVAFIRNVSPVMGAQMVPQQVCGQVTTQAQAGGSSLVGASIGGVAGALLGNQIGRGNGRTAATALGAVVGAITGDRLDNRPQPVVQQECHNENHVVSVVTGFMVTFEYNGRMFQNMMSHDPSQAGNTTMRVDVSVIPQ